MASQPRPGAYFSLGVRAVCSGTSTILRSGEAPPLGPEFDEQGEFEVLVDISLNADEFFAREGFTEAARQEADALGARLLVLPEMEESLQAGEVE
jgi:hypothetical protein